MSNENIQEELQKMTEEQKLEKFRKEPLLDVVNNRKELREIAENAKDIIKSINPGIVDKMDWQLVIRVTMEFISASVKYLTKLRSTDYDIVYLDLGDMMQIGIEFKRFDAEKEGTFNIAIRPKSGFLFDGQELRLLGESVQADNEDLTLKYLYGDYNLNIKQLKEICNIAMNVLIKDYSVASSAEHWEVVLLLFHGFMTAARVYLIAHKDAGDAGLEIDLGNVVNIGVEKFEEDEDGVCDYELYITPGQIIKLGGKNDAETEK